MTFNGSFRSIIILREDVNQLGDYSTIVSCCDSGVCGAETFDIAVTADGKPFNVFPPQFAIIVLGFLLIGTGITLERLRMFKDLNFFSYQINLSTH